MKKLLLILLCLPMIGFGQTAKDYYDKASDYEKNEEYQLAIANYTKCLKIDPDFADAYLNRGKAYNYLGYLEDAIADYTRAIEIDPDYVRAYYCRGVAYDDLGDYKVAIANFTRAIRIDPDFADGYFQRGWTKEREGMSYCRDYKKCCDLGEEICCEWYNELCK